MTTPAETRARPSSYGIAPHVPIVFLANRGTFDALPRLGPAAAPYAANTVGCLGRLRQVLQGATHAREARRRQALDEATRSFLALMQALAPVRREVEKNPERSALAVHTYFGVVPVRLSPEQHASEAVGIIFRLIADLAFALLDVNEALTEVECAMALLRAFLGPYPSAREPRARGTAPPVVEPCYCPQGDPLERWAFAHHAYFLFNIYAEAEIQHALQALEEGNEGGASIRLNVATMYIRGFSATMMHSGAVSAAFYREVIRPTMRPPAAPILLTGSMQPEHAAYRATLKTFLQKVPESFGDLALRSLELALARDACLEADLIDIERHVCVAHALVGDEHSLVQHVEAPINAVSALRGMYQARLRQYAPMMRFGEVSCAQLRAAERTEECEVR
jgi:hypothetical protein